MAEFITEGGRTVCGSVKISSAKNALLPILAACVAVGDKCTIRDFPSYKDTQSMLDIISALGGSFTLENRVAMVDTSGVKSGKFPFDIFKKIRASVFMLGAVISRVGYAEAVYPGGCRIGSRPIDIHLDGLRRMGCKITCDGDRFFCECDRLEGAEICMPFPSVGATENLMIAAATAEGGTVIRNAAREPEVVDLANFLNACGAKVNGAGNSTVTVEGVKRLCGCEYKAIPDRIETGTYAMLTMLLGGEIEISGDNIQNILAIINKTRNSACKIYSFNDKIYIKANGMPKGVGKITALPFPGFPTDMQAQAIALLSVADGESQVSDGVFPDRFACVGQLNKLGADISVKASTAFISGVKGLHAGNVVAEDLRGGAGLVMACLKAEGRSVISGAELIDRGYDGFENKLSALGLNIKRVN